MCGWRKTVETCAKVTSDTKCNQSIDSDLERYTAYMVAVTEVSGASLRYAIQGFLEPLDLVFWSQLASKNLTQNASGLSTGIYRFILLIWLQKMKFLGPG